jgi:hypothetical protein
VNRRGRSLVRSRNRKVVRRQLGFATFCRENRSYGQADRGRDKDGQLAHPLPDLLLRLQSCTGQDVKESPFSRLFRANRGSNSAIGAR